MIYRPTKSVQHKIEQDLGSAFKAFMATVSAILEPERMARSRDLANGTRPWALWDWMV